MTTTLHKVVLPILELCTNVIKWYILFYEWLFAQYYESICVIVRSNSFIFIAVQYPIVWIYNLSILLPLINIWITEFMAIINRDNTVALNIHVYDLWDIYLPIYM